MEQIQERLKQAKQQIASIRSRVARRDLVKMLNPINTVLNKLDQESVECRRLHRPTARYQTLEQEAEDLVKNLEKYLLFACLLGGWLQTDSVLQLAIMISRTSNGKN